MPIVALQPPRTPKRWPPAGSSWHVDRLGRQQEIIMVTSHETIRKLAEAERTSEVSPVGTPVAGHFWPNQQGMQATSTRAIPPLPVKHNIQ